MSASLWKFVVEVEVADHEEQIWRKRGSRGPIDWDSRELGAALLGSAKCLGSRVVSATQEVEISAPTTHANTDLDVPSLDD